MSSLSIVFVGPSMAGRRTSLSSVLRDVGEKADASTLGPGPHSLSVQGQEVCAVISVARSSFHYQDASDIDVPDEVRNEVDVLSRADGVIFVLDSQVARQPANDDELEKLTRDLSSRGISMDDIPIVFQANKRDLPSALPLAELGRRFPSGRGPLVESIAIRGIGVLDAVSQLVQRIREMKRPPSASA